LTRNNPVQIRPLRLELETLGTFRAPEYQGALFRGGFGKHFRDLTCVTRAPDCRGCSRSRACPYSMVFETPVDPERFQVLRKYPHAPHPFVLAPEMSAARELRAGSSLSLHVTLIGPGVGYLPHFLVVFDAMGREGRFGGRFRIRRVVAATGGGIVYDGASRQFIGEPPDWTWPAESACEVRRLSLEFLTPLRMRTTGEYNTSPSFAELTQALLRRAHLLRALYGDGTVDTAWMAPLLRDADEAVVEAAEWKLFEWGRTSGRQDRRVPMDGVLGRITVRGNLTALAPWYRLGEWIHIGNGTSMGLGRFRVKTESDDLTGPGQ